MHVTEKARMTDQDICARAIAPRRFADRLGIRIPIFLAPMAGACPPALSIAVANAGGLGACGALLMNADAIAAWCDEFRRGSSGGFQLNLWIPDPPPVRDRDRESRQREFLATWGPAVPPEAGEGVLPDFDAQCAAMLAARPRVISSIMGLYAPEFVAEMKGRGIFWFATATTVDEARAAEAAGPMRSSPKAWRPAAIVAPSAPTRRNRTWWG